MNSLMDSSVGSMPAEKSSAPVLSRGTDLDGNVLVLSPAPTTERLRAGEAELPLVREGSPSVSPREELPLNPSSRTWRERAGVADL